MDDDACFDVPEHGLTASDVPLVMMTPSFAKPFVPSSYYGRMGDPAGAG